MTRRTRLLILLFAVCVSSFLLLACTLDMDRSSFGGGGNDPDTFLDRDDAVKDARATAVTGTREAGK